MSSRFLILTTVHAVLSPSDQAEVTFVAAQMREYEKFYSAIGSTDGTKRQILCADLLRATFADLYGTIESTAAREQPSQLNSPWLFEKYCSPEGYAVSSVPPLWSMVPLELITSTIQIQDEEKTSTEVESLASGRSTTSLSPTTLPSLPKSQVQTLQLTNTPSSPTSQVIQISSSSPSSSSSTSPLSSPYVSEDLPLEGSPTFTFSDEEVAGFFPDGLTFEIDAIPSTSENTIQEGISKDALQKILTELLEEQSQTLTYNLNPEEVLGQEGQGEYTVFAPSSHELPPSSVDSESSAFLSNK